MSEHRITLTLNGQARKATVEGRTSLTDYLRGEAGCTGVHAGCEHGVCGACTVIVDGRAVRSCLMLAVQADGSSVTTPEGLAAPDGTLSLVQQTLKEEHALQCGFCTSGAVMTLTALAGDPALEAAMSGHICRCTGYQGLRRAAQRLSGGLE